MTYDHVLMSGILLVFMIAVWALNNWHIRRMEQLFSTHRERMAEIMAPLYGEDGETNDET